MRKQLYLSIIAQLKLIQLNEQGKYITATVSDDKKSAIKHFDIWNNNLNYISEIPPFSRPAVFFQFLPITWEVRNKGIRSGDVSVTLHVVTDNRAPSSKENNYETKSLDFFDLLDSIYGNLNTLEDTFFRHITSTGSATDHDHDDLIDSMETYSVQVTDNSAVKILPTVSVTPDLNVGFK